MSCHCVSAHTEHRLPALFSTWGTLANHISSEITCWPKTLPHTQRDDGGCCYIHCDSFISGNFLLSCFRHSSVISLLILTVWLLLVVSLWVTALWAFISWCYNTCYISVSSTPCAAWGQGCTVSSNVDGRRSANGMKITEPINAHVYMQSSWLFLYVTIPMMAEEETEAWL